MKTWMLVLPKIFAKTALVVFFLHFLGGLSWMASIAVALVVPTPDWSRHNRIDTEHFVPYQIHIEPVIGRMLLDLGIITEKRWEEIREANHDDQPWSGWAFAKRGAIGNVISMDRRGGELVNWVPTNHYSSSVELSRTIDFVTLPGGGSRDGWSPDYFFRLGTGGYHQGIDVHETWWKENRARLDDEGLIKSVDDDSIRYGRVRLTLSIFPNEAFLPFHIEPTRELEGKISSRANELGWERSDLGGEWGPSRDSFRNRYGYIVLNYVTKDR
jgi:hypothetical protein